MKRILLTILTVFYLGVASGASVHFHYCMGELVSWGLEKDEAKSCGFCGMSKSESKKKSCCADVEQKAKVEQSQKAGPTVYKFDQLSTAVILPEMLAIHQAPVPVKTALHVWSNAPPYEQVPVFIKNCTYRI